MRSTVGLLLASMTYVLYQGLSGEELLKHAWDDCVRGMNLAIDVYGIGKVPRYAAIDAMTHNPKTEPALIESAGMPKRVIKSCFISIASENSVRMG